MARECMAIVKFRVPGRAQALVAKNLRPWHGPEHVLAEIVQYCR